MTTILVAGATGTLGRRIVHHLLDADGIDVRLLVRDGHPADSAKQALLQDFAGRGAHIAVGTVTDPDSLDAAVAGVDVVISALQGGREVIVGGQVALAQAAKRAGARRFLPSDFALDIWAAPAEAPTLALRRDADDRIDQLGLEVLHVLNGGFLDMMINRGPAMVDLDQPQAVYWGGGDDEFDMTTVEDTAKFTARLAADLEAPAGTYRISGGRASFNNLADAIGQRTGSPVPTRSLGSLEQLRDNLQAAGDPWSQVMQWYTLALLTTPPFANTANDRYPGVQPETIEQYLDRKLTRAS